MTKGLVSREKLFGLQTCLLATWLFSPTDSQRNLVRIGSVFHSNWQRLRTDRPTGWLAERRETGQDVIILAYQSNKSLAVLSWPPTHVESWKRCLTGELAACWFVRCVVLSSLLVRPLPCSFARSRARSFARCFRRHGVGGLAAAPTTLRGL